MCFEENRGQADPAARFVARGSGGVLLLCDHEIVVAVAPNRSNDEAGQSASLVSISFPGSNPASRPEARKPAAGLASYFTGQQPGDWISGIPTSRRVVWPELYPGIDLVCYGRGKRLEYDFLVRAGADPGVIRLAFDGVDALRIDAQGNLRLDTPAGELVHQAPVVSQDTDAVSGAFQLTGEGAVAFVLGEYDPSVPLLIDPVMQFCSYLGGDYYEAASEMIELPDGTLVVSGYTGSSDFPLKDSLKSYDGKNDLFITGLSPDGRQIIFSTFFGGSDSEYGAPLAAGPDGSIWFAGNTISTDLPLMNPVQSAYGGLFLGQLGPGGTNLLFSTYYGASNTERVEDLAVDSESRVALVGYTQSSVFPLVNAAHSTPGVGTYIDDAIALCLAPDRSVAYATRLGGPESDRAYGVAIGSGGSVFITGWTSSPAFQPIGGGMDGSHNGGQDAFVTKLDDSGARVWSTFLGGSAGDFGWGVALDANENVLIGGHTGPSGFPMVNPIRSGGVESEMFLAKLNASGSALVYSTLVGGNRIDQCRGVAVDAAGNAYIAGYTHSSDFPSVNCWPKKTITSTQADVSVAAVDAAGNDFLFAGQFGGNAFETASAINLARNGDVLLAGYSQSSDLPLLRAIDPVSTDNYDGFFARMTATSSASVPFVEGFEWGLLNGCWERSGNVQLRSSPAPHGGTYQLAFGISAYQLEQATLSVDLAGRSSTSLRFWYKHALSPNGLRHGTLLPGTFSGNANGNGVAISGDGVNWVKLAGFADSESIPVSYTRYDIELDPIMAAHGIGNAGLIYIKFVGYATNPPEGSHLVDDITILSRSVQFESDRYATPEGQAVTLTVQRSGSTNAAESVDYATYGLDASEGVDYVGQTGVLTFAAGDASETITVQVPDDPEEEADETFRVQLSNPSANLDLGAASSATVTIQDDDASEVFPFRVGFESGALGDCWTTYTEVGGLHELDENDGSSGYPDTPAGRRSLWLDASSYGLSELTLHIDLSGQSNVYLSFLVKRISGDDFTLPDTFTGHANGKGVALSTDGTTWHKLQGLTVPEAGSFVDWRNFTIDLDSAMAARGLSYGPSVQIKFVMYGNRFFDALGFDDIQVFSPRFEFSSLAFPTLETDAAVLGVLRQGGSNGVASVAYHTADGSATAGVDYTAVSGTLRFEDGETSKHLTVPVHNEYTAEANETFWVTLSNPSAGYSLGVVNPATVTLIDDDNAASLPVDEPFNALADYWDTYRGAGVELSELVLQDGGLSEAILTFDAAGASNVVLRFTHSQNWWDDQVLPETFVGHGLGDGVALSVDGTNWVKVLGLSRSEGMVWAQYEGFEVELDSLLAGHELTYNDHVQLKFQCYSTASAKTFHFDDVVVCSRAPLESTTAHLPHGTGMVAYTTSLMVGNGTGPFVWSTASDLPGGLTLSETGLLSGTPTEEGVFALTLQVEDAWGATGQTHPTLTIDPNANRPPYARLRDPAASVWPMAEQTNLLFTLEADDPEGVGLGYSWFLDDTQVATTPSNHRHQTVWGDAGEYVLSVRVSDGLWNNLLASWTLQVSPDNDGDGMSNTWERSYGLDPWDASDAGEDPDGDFLTNLQESGLLTRPDHPDSNGDGLGDGWQNLYGQDPLQARSMPRLRLNRLGSVGGFSNITAVAAYAEAVYVADGVDGWKIFDTSIATNPVLRTSYATEDYAWHCRVEGSRLFFAEGTNGLLKIPLDSTDPYTLSYSQRYTFTGIQLIRSTVRGETAYVSTQNAVSDFHTIDLSDFVPDPFLGDLDTSNSVRDVALQADLAYVAGGDDEFSIIDVSNPAAPLLRSTLPIPGAQGFEVAMGGDVAYVGANDGTIYIADVSNPDAPVWTDTNNFTSAAVQQLLLQDGFLFLAQDGAGIYQDGGLYVFDETNRTWSTSMFSDLGLDHLKDICLTSNRLYAVDAEQGLVVYDYTADYDQDGLQDAWERRLLGSLAYGADDDPDGDGLINLGEQRAGLDPMDPDSDGDHMQDKWEVDQLFDPGDTADAANNADGDFFTNVDEFTADTNPHDPADYFHVLDVSTGLPVMLNFDSSTRRLYTLMGCSNLIDTLWIPVPGAGPRSGLGGPDSLSDTNQPPKGPYYRLDVQLP